MLLTLLSVRWLSFRNALLRAAPRERGRARAGLLWSPAVVALVGIVAYQFLSPFVELARVDPSMEAVLEGLPSAALFTAFWLLLLSAITVGIQSFYLNQEMPLLLSSPVPARSVFLARFVEATAANAGLFLVVGAPVMLAYSLARGYITPPHIVYLVLVLVPFCALPTSVGVVLAVLLMRVLPASRARDVFGSLGIAAFACVYLALSIGVRHLDDQSALRQGTARLAHLVDAPVMRHGPWQWAGEVVRGQTGATETWAAIGLLWAAAAAAVWLAAGAAQWLHWRGWAKAQETTPRQGPSAAMDGWERRLGFLPGPVRGVFLKDLRSLRRDMRQLSMFLIPVAVVAVFLYQVPRTPEIGRLPSLLPAMTLYPILAMIALRLAMSGFVTESRAMWLMLSSPNRPGAFVAGKFLYAYALSVPLAVAASALYGLMRAMPALDWLLTGAMALLAVAGFCGIGVGASVLFSDFQAENPRFTLSAGARLLTFIWQMVYMLALAGVTVGAWAFAHYRPEAGALIYAAGAAVVLATTAGFALPPLALGSRRLRRLEW